jgi:hypothetical protein
VAVAVAVAVAVTVAVAVAVTVTVVVAVTVCDHPRPSQFVAELARIERAFGERRSSKGSLDRMLRGAKGSSSAATAAPR